MGEANPPDFLLGYAADEWFRAVDELLRLKLVTIIDLNVLAAHCQAYSRWRTKHCGELGPGVVYRVVAEVQRECFDPSDLSRSGDQSKWR